MAEPGALLALDAALGDGHPRGGSSDLTAGLLVTDGHCSAVCLLARRINDDCDCPCHGRWHGVLAGLLMPATAPLRRSRTAQQDGPDLLDLLDASGGAADLTEGC